MTGLALLAIGLLFVPFAVWGSRWTTRNATLFLVLSAALLGFLAPTSPPSILSGTLHLLLPFLFFRLGGLVRLEDLKGRYSQSWALLALITLIGVFFMLFPITRSLGLTWRLAVLAMAPGPILALTLTREFAFHGSGTRVFLTGIVVQSLIFSLAFMGIQSPPSGLFSLLERFFTLTLISIILGGLNGLILAYAETKIVQDSYLQIFTFGVLFFTLGLLWKLSIAPPLTFLILGLVSSNASIRSQAAHRVVAGVEVPAIVLFLFGSFWALRPLALPSSLWIFVAYLIGRTLSRGIGILLFFPKEDALSRRQLFGMSLLQGGTSLWLLSSYLNGLFLPKFAIFLLAIIGLFAIQRILAVEAGAFHPFLETPFFQIRWTGILRHFLENLGWQRPKRQLRYAQDLMRKHYVSVHPDDSLEAIIQAITKSHALAIPVVNTNEEYLGLIQAHNLELLALDETTRQLIRALDLANPQYFVSPHEPLGTTLHTMERFDLDCLPVVERQRILGVLYRRDLVLEYV